MLIEPENDRVFDVTAQPHPLRSEVVRGQVAEGASLRELGAGQRVFAFVDGARVEDLSYEPKAGESVVLKAIVEGNSGGKNALRLVATIAVVVASGYVGAPVAAGGLGYGAVAGAAVSIAGQIAINALIPPPTQSLDAANSFQPFRNGASYGNSLVPFGVIPRLYGKHRLYPPLAARPYTEQVGKDQFLRMLFCLGYGPLTIDEASFKLGDTLLTEFEVETEIREGAPGDLPITLFSRNVAEENLSVILDEDGQTETRSTGSGAREISIDFVAPALIFFKGGKSLPVATGFMVEYKKTTDPTWTLVKPVSLGGIATITSESEGGYSDFFPFKQAGGTVVSEVQDRISPDAWAVKGPAFYVTGHDTRPYALSLRLAMPTAAAYDVRVTRKFAVTRGAVPLAYEFDGDTHSYIGAPPIPGYPPTTLGPAASIAEEPEATLASEVMWTALRTIGNDIGQTVPEGLAFIAMRIKLTDQIGGVVDNFSCIATSRLQVYNGAIWSEQDTSNPAWVYRDILRGSANARPISASRIDDADLYAWSLECVAAGREFNAVFDGRTTVYEALKNVAATGRASFQRKDGKYTTVRDKPGLTPVQMFTPRNSWDFSGRKAFIKQPHALKIKFKDRDPQSDWADSERIVYADGYSEANATEFETLSLFGITDSDQIWKDGRYFMAVARLRPETFSWNADVENLVCLRGDVVRHQHDAVLLGLGAARIKDITGSALTMDDEFTQELGKTYQLRIRKADGSNVIVNIVTVPGTSHILTLTGAVPAGVEIGNLAAFGETAKVTQEILITGITPLNDLQATITAVPYSQPAIDESDSGEIPAYDPLVTQPPLYPAEPTIIRAYGGTFIGRRNSNGSITPRIAVVFTFPSGGVQVSRIDGEVRKADDTSFDPRPQKANRGVYYFDIADVGTDYVVRVRGVGVNGLVGPWAEAPVTLGDSVEEGIFALTLLEQPNNPASPNNDLSTVVATVLPPPISNTYDHALIDYRRKVVGQLLRGWKLLGRTNDDNQASVVIPRDGLTYEFRARAVSKTGYEDTDGPVAEIIMSNAGTDIPGDDDAPTDAALNVHNLRIRGQLPAVSVFTGADAQLAWDVVVPPGTMTLRDYRVQIIDPLTGDIVRVEYVVRPRYDYTLVKNTNDAAEQGYAGPMREFTVRVIARTEQGYISATPAAKTIENPPPVLPGDFVYYAYFDAIELRFSRPTDGDYVGAKVYVSVVPGFTPTSAELFYDGAETQPIYIPGMPSGETLYFRIVLADSFGDGSISVQYSVATEALPGEDTTPPGAVTGLVLSSIVESAELWTLASLTATWDASTDDSGLVSYELEYWTDPSRKTTQATTQLSFTINPADVGVLYNVRVRAIDYSGNASAWSSVATHTVTGDSGAPSNVTGAAATAGLDKVVVTWVNPTDADFLQTRVYRGTTAGFTANSGSLLTTTRGTTLVDATVTNGTGYYYKFSTVDVSGNASAPSAATGPAVPFKITNANVAAYFASAAISDAYIQNLDAVKITAGDIAAARMQATVVTAIQATVSQLSAITADLGTITAGIITGALIRTAASGQRVELSSVAGVGLRTINSVGAVTSQLNTNGSGFLGVGSGANGLSWDTAGAVTIKGDTITSGTITGPLFKTTGTWSVEIGAQSLNLDADGATTYVFAYRNGLTSKLRLDQAGNMRLGGNLELDAGGDIHSVKTSYADISSGVGGYWLGWDAGVVKFDIGDGSNYVRWTGSALVVQGTIRTASSGQRVVLTSGNETEFYDDVASRAASIGIKTNGSDTFYVSGGLPFATGNVANPGTTTQGARIGVAGYSFSSYGVLGQTKTGYAVYGLAYSGVGGLFSSFTTTSVGVIGEGGAAGGQFSATTAATGQGVSGSGRTGVNGTSTNNFIGVSGDGTTGVFGLGSSVGLHGQCNASTGLAGVRAQQLSATVGASIWIDAGVSNTGVPTHSARSGSLVVRYISSVAKLYLQTGGGYNGNGTSWVALN